MGRKAHRQTESGPSPRDHPCAARLPPPPAAVARRMVPRAFGARKPLRLDSSSRLPSKTEFARRAVVAPPRKKGAPCRLRLRQARTSRSRASSAQAVLTEPAPGSHRSGARSAVERFGRERSRRATVADCRLPTATTAGTTFFEPALQPYRQHPSGGGCTQRKDDVTAHRPHYACIQARAPNPRDSSSADAMP
jgi:hypothetical protein